MIKIKTASAIVAVLAIVSMSFGAVAKADYGGHNNRGLGNLFGNSAPNANTGISQPSFTIGSPSDVRITGAKLSAGFAATTSTGSFPISIFGLNLTINVNSATQFSGLTASSSLMNSGDSLDIRGSIDPATGALTAASVSDKSLGVQSAQSILQQIAALFAQLRMLRGF